MNQAGFAQKKEVDLLEARIGSFTPLSKFDDLQKKVNTLAS